MSINDQKVNLVNRSNPEILKVYKLNILETKIKFSEIDIKFLKN